MTTASRTTNITMPAAVQEARHTNDSAFDERRTDRLMIRRFRAEDASSLAAYRSEPTVARYQSWDIPFTNAQAQAFIDSFGATNPDTPGAWYQLALIEAATGRHVGDVAAGVDAGRRAAAGGQRDRLSTVSQIWAVVGRWNLSCHRVVSVPSTSLLLSLRR
jgi:hypothetical protein